ncbi:MAG: hypothetical protein OXC19_16635 [Bryobacterales bacterium]|nr:hypothetical protein [Bryobacterales bacterium]
MTAFVVDSNVAIVANGCDTHADIQCQLTCVEKVRSVLQHGVVVIDDDGEILKEYGRQLKIQQKKGRGMSGVGNEFFIHLFNHQYSNHRVRRIAITKSADDRRGYDQLPENTLDRSDRKFLAVAVVAKAVLLNATDSDWDEQKALIEKVGVELDQLCPQHASKATRRRQ